jgi:hypothetical protein
MESSNARSKFRRNLGYGLSAIAIAVGLKYGFDFGNQISGPLMGIVGAISGAVFCALTLDFITDLVFPERKDRQ